MNNKMGVRIIVLMVFMFTFFFSYVQESIDILERDSGNIVALNGKAMIALDNGKINKSIQYLEKAIAIDSANITSFVHFSQMLS